MQFNVRLRESQRALMMTAIGRKADIDLGVNEGQLTAIVPLKGDCRDRPTF